MPTPFVSARLTALPGIAHGFFSRIGGVSDGIYASLNCGLGSRDERPAVIENRRRVARLLGAEDLVTLYQAHTATARFIDRPVAATDLPPADAVVTATPGLAVGALAADCAPVLFADPQARIVAAAHAGWRGAVNGILEATIDTMVTAGAKREHITAAVGPCIGLASYEVGPDFEADLLARDAGNARFFATPPGKTRVHFDLSSYVAARLSACGIPAVDQLSQCTFTNESLFSYRRSQAAGEPDYGRQISAIVVI